MTTLLWHDLAIEVPREVSDGTPEEVVAYEQAALDAACRAKHGLSLEAYRAIVEPRADPDQPPQDGGES